MPEIILPDQRLSLRRFRLVLTIGPIPKNVDQVSNNSNIDDEYYRFYGCHMVDEFI
jgi:hypothetical protein